MSDTNPVTQELVERSNRLGADPRNTNYAGGNTSAKGTVTDPVTSRPTELLWVKGSGGDLGTLTEAGLAVLRLDRLRSLVEVYPGVEREDEMVAAFDYCLHGKGGAAPSIDTAMHGLVDAPHIDHLHPDSGIALATAADGEALTKECFGDRVAWVDWRRPGFQLGLDIADVKRANPQAIGVILGGHGITAWGDTSEECERNSLDIIRTAETFIAEHGKAEPFGSVVPGFEPLPDAERRARAAALAPVIRGLASTDAPQLGHFTDSPGVLDFLSREKLQPLAALGTSCPDHFLRTKVRPLVVDLPGTTPLEDVVIRLKELHAAYREEYAAYYDRHAVPDSPAMRGADPAIVLVPGVGMFSFGKDKQTARVAGEFYVNAINVMRGAEALSPEPPRSTVSAVTDRDRLDEPHADPSEAVRAGIARVREHGQEVEQPQPHEQPPEAGVLAGTPDGEPDRDGHRYGERARERDGRLVARLVAPDDRPDREPREHEPEGGGAEHEETLA